MRGSWLEFAILCIAVWRATHLCLYDYGPGHILEAWRERIGVRCLPDGRVVIANSWAELFTCPWCLSIWWALPAALLWQGLSWWALPAWGALAGAAALIAEGVRRIKE